MPRSICAHYHIGRKLGAGACGVVRLVYNRRTCVAYAMKHIRKVQLLTASKPAPGNDGTPNRDALRIANEGKIMRSLQHPCVVQMHDVIDSADSVFIMLELMHGGDLLSRIVGRKRLPERTAKLYFVQLCQAVKYLHDKNVTHRDLKPDNVLLQTDDEETLLKVSDFGLSKALGGGGDNDSVMRTLCGTPLYVAPEVLLTGGRGSYTNKVDIWSLGVVLFTCLSGTLPFSDEYGSAACDQIKKGKFAYRSAAWRGVSVAAKALIDSMLTVRAERRLSIDEVLASAWLQDEEVLRRAEKIMKVPLVMASVKRPVADAVKMAAPLLPLRMEVDVPMKCAATGGGGGGGGDGGAVDDDEPMMRTKTPSPSAEDQENVSANFLQPPAAKRRRIEQM